MLIAIVVLFLSPLKNTLFEFAGTIIVVFYGVCLCNFFCSIVPSISAIAISAEYIVSPPERGAEMFNLGLAAAKLTVVPFEFLHAYDPFKSLSFFHRRSRGPASHARRGSFCRLQSLFPPSCTPANRMSAVFSNRQSFPSLKPGSSPDLASTRTCVSVIPSSNATLSSVSIGFSRAHVVIGRCLAFVAIVSPPFTPRCRAHRSSPRCALPRTAPSATPHSSLKAPS